MVIGFYCRNHGISLVQLNYLCHLRWNPWILPGNALLTPPSPPTFLCILLLTLLMTLLLKGYPLEGCILFRINYLE